MQFRLPERAFAPFYQHPVAFYGERAGQRKVAICVNCMVVEDSPLTVTDSAAPVRVRTFAIAFPRASWPFVDAPDVGEWVHFEWNGVWIWAKAGNVARLPAGDLSITAMQTQEELGGPPWLR